PADRVVAVSGRLILVSGIGSGIGPLLGTWIMAGFGLNRGLFPPALPAGRPTPPAGGPGTPRAPPPPPAPAPPHSAPPAAAPAPRGASPRARTAAAPRGPGERAARPHRAGGGARRPGGGGPPPPPGAAGGERAAPDRTRQRHQARHRPAPASDQDCHHGA